MDYLATALENREKRLKKLLPIEGKLRAASIMRNDYAGFRTALDRGESQLSLVAQISRSHPNNAETLSSSDVPVVARRFFECGIQGISYLCEPTIFDGSTADLAQISRISPVPVLARGLWLHAVEVCQAIVSGADAINLIPSLFAPSQLKDVYSVATGLGLDVMVEVHDLSDVERALDLEAELVCINHTDLHTLTYDPDRTEKLIEEFPASTIVLSSGGIKSVADAQRVLEAGSHGIIIGTALQVATIPHDLANEILSLELPSEDEL
jgi:indole-3-glycerol phosphate synthase